MDQEAREELRSLIRRLIEEPGDTFDPADIERMRVLIGKPPGWLRRWFSFESLPLEIGPWQLDWLNRKCLELRRLVPDPDRPNTAKFELWHICFEVGEGAAIMREVTITKEYRLWRWKIRRSVRRMFPRKRPR